MGSLAFTLSRSARPIGFFGDVIQAGFHETSVRKVAAGEIDASAIDSPVLAIEMRDHPEVTDNLRVIEALGPSTIQPVAVSKRFDDDFRNKVRDFLTGFHRDSRGQALLALGTVEKFVPAGPADYDDIRRMVDACEAADFMEIR